MTTEIIAARVQALAPARLREMARGVEKESLRVLPDGRLAQTPHPLALGSALTHPQITTDFSESQLEFVTGVHAGIDACLSELAQIHRYAYQVLAAGGDDQRLWVNSMPCMLPADDEIPIGQYGRSNIGQLKSVYRMGLSYRYGRRMQTISGIHYNWSLPGLGNDEYFGLLRNFRRHSFLLLWLFGASPAICSSFVAGRDHRLEPLVPGRLKGTLHLPHATSLRMGNLGYQSSAQASLQASFNSLEGYAASLQTALTDPYPAYEAIGVRGPEGDYRQLDTSLLQIENELYGTIRPKRVVRRGERPLHALRERGVEYVEVRLMDLDPFEPIGIAADTLRVLDIFLIHCLLADSPPDSPEELAALARNQQRTAAEGRAPTLRLERGAEEVLLVDWAAQLLTAFEPIAGRLDTVFGGEDYRRALAQARTRLEAPAGLPSARVLESLRDAHDGSFVSFGRAWSERARESLLATPLTPAVQASFEAAARDSLAEQARLEAADVLPFEAFRVNYLAPEGLRV